MPDLIKLLTSVIVDESDFHTSEIASGGIDPLYSKSLNSQSGSPFASILKLNCFVLLPFPYALWSASSKSGSKNLLSILSTEYSLGL